MRSRLFLAGCCFLAASIGLSYYFLNYQAGWVLAAFPAAGIASLIAHRKQGVIPSSLWLVLLIFLSGYGITLGMPAAVMILISACSLGGWELTLSCRDLKQNASLEESTRRNWHYFRYLGLTLLLGSGLAEASAFLRLQLPFGVILLLVLVVQGSLHYALKAAQKI